jgi:putative PIN family toxin of toxin-antitoxin system
MKVFLDTNVIVSAVTTRGLCADVLRAVLADHELVTSLKVLQEIRCILKSKFSVPDELINEYLGLIGEESLPAESEEKLSLPIKDMDDGEIVSAAVAARVQVLVTGDREVQTIKSIEGMRILSPRAFWEELTAQPGVVAELPRLQKLLSSPGKKKRPVRRRRASAPGSERA